MKKIREYIPFILLAISLFLTVLRHFNFYSELYNYLGDLCGYSILTNLFMYSVYMNNKYCTSTKVAVLGLFSLNLFNIIYTFFGVNGVVYDLYIIIITVLIIAVYKKNKQ